ncbi:MAG: amidase [Hyphomicrobiaceae bacterium]
MSDITQMTAVEIASAVSTRKLAASEVTDAFLKRIDALNPSINAVCTRNPDAAGTAAAIDKRLARGEPPRPLEGVPFLVKDNLETAGLLTTFGSRLMQDHVPSESAICVERLTAAGGILLGKTNTPEFAHDVNTSNLIFGTTRNPWDPMVTAGGSSGGSGAAVAAGFAPIAVGTDLGGSIRIPASFNNLVGIRPAPGRVPFYPTDFAWDTLVPHLAGPLATTVADAALMLSVMSGPDDRDPTSLPASPFDPIATAAPRVSLAGRRVALTIDLGGIVPVDPEVALLTRQAAATLERLGARVEEIEFDASDLRDIVAGTRSFGMVARYADRYDKHSDLMTGQLKNQVEAAFKMDVRTIVQAERLRTAYWRRVCKIMSTFDYILTPVCGAPPFRLDVPLPQRVGGKAVERFYDVFLPCYAFSITGLPLISLPAGSTASGLPVGIQLAARRLREDSAIEAAAAYASAVPHLFRRPSVDPTKAGPIPAILPTPGMVLR